MKKHRKTGKSVTNVALLSLTGVVLFGCAQIRLLTYPHTFTWIGDEDVKTSMQAMAKSMKELNHLVADEGISGSNRSRILIELDNIEYLAASLAIRTPMNDTDAPSTNHLVIDEHMDEFLHRVMQAKLQAELSPANYFGVGQLTGACTGCHRFR